MDGRLPADSVEVQVSREEQQAQALHSAALLDLRAGDTKRAVERLKKATRLSPSFAQAHNHLGVALGMLGDTEAAVKPFAAASELDAEFSDAHLNLGAALKALGQNAAAAVAYQRALATSPENEEARVELARLWVSLEKQDRALRALEDPPGLPASAHLALHRGLVWRQTADLAAAEAEFRRSAQLDPDNLLAQNNLGCLLRETGRAKEATRVLRRAVALQPSHAAAQLNLGVAQLANAQPAEALDTLRRSLELQPGQTLALALKALAHQELGQAPLARELVDFDRFLFQKRVSGVEDLPALNAALSRHVQEHPTLVADPSAQATRDGLHSGNLLAEPKGPVQVLERLIRSAIAEYVASLAGQSAHPFLQARPEQAELQAWGVVLGSGGHQLPHIHPRAWLSGVYYAQVPDASQLASEQSCLEFGRPPADYPLQAAPRLRFVRPEPGLLVLFPSYFYHRTIPFEQHATRVSIAFDVSPAGT